MGRSRVVRGVVPVLVALAVAAGGMQAPASAAGSAGSPPVSLPSSPTGLTSPVPLPAGVDPVSPYLPQVSCNPVDMAGPLMLRDLLLSTYGVGRPGSISRGCTEGLSEHSEGRAMDWMVDTRRPAERAAAADFIAWVTRDGGLNARRLGIMYVIYNKKIWSVYNAKAGWRKSYAHTDHVHVSFSWAGARGSTSFWTGAVGVVDVGPCVRFAGSYAPPTGSPRTARCGTPTKALVRTSWGNRAYGSSGGTVRRAQTLLGVPVTSRFDRATWNATRAHQRAHDLPMTGALDQPTWGSLDRGSIRRRTVAKLSRRQAAARGVARYSSTSIAPGRAAEAVVVLQTALGLATADRNGFYGPVTRAAVERVQAGAGLAVDGVVDGPEWQAIRAALG
ncbi:peptidoglycan-binding protein [Aeromicrobium sp. CFBP 8757]|uniref:peptidoglycan-binding domain-containing protein n=1 Tax=Aeromicrobium sp. CFBP 8757 TaxID=2775288 RepID=UPI0017816388|nr:peptidoglycan-binding protein [Aeromicrobium sp. CFBP 8757]MBD8606838.1 peptidoglycan-binding protein [Aeromicrobium sp. CFBP 8757]